MVTMKDIPPPNCVLPADADGLLRLSGNWTLATALRSGEILHAQTGAVTGIDARGIDRLDSAGVLLLLRYAHKLGLPDDALQFRADHQALVCTIEEVADERPKPQRDFGVAAALDRLGRSVHAIAGNIVVLVNFLGENLAKLARLIRQPRRFRLTAAGRLVHLDLIWSGQAMSTETVMSWELEPMKIEDESSPLTVRDVIDRHDGEMWLEREKVRHRAFFRILLPAATPQEQAEAETYLRGESRPEYYDFDLFAWSEKSHALDDRLLSELSYTVFDTETTGLNPSQGDEIIQIGATRILNGKLLRAESFEQLVDPERPLAPESAKIHGITSEMLRGQPTIDKVLPAFHAFSADTVLIAHNAAFDMRFLQLKEEETGLRFDHPVLDTLLLSAVIHPNQESHRLEAIAERLGLTIVGRHTALGDAIVTAEVFLKLVPLLADKGIRTLREAREAAEQSYYARIKY